IMQNVCAHQSTHTHSCTHTHTLMHTLTHTHIHTYTHTHIHTYTHVSKFIHHHGNRHRPLSTFYTKTVLTGVLRAKMHAVKMPGFLFAKLTRGGMLI